MNWAVNDTENIYYFEAMTDVAVRRAPKEETLVFVKEHPDVLFNLLKPLYKGLDGMLLRMSYLMSGSAQARLLTELIIQAKRFGKKRDDGSLELAMSETQLASYAGMTRETVSREMKHLKEKNLVQVEKDGLIIRTIEGLDSELLQNS